MGQDYVAAVILASGKGTRFGLIKKQFAKLAGRQVFLHSFEEINRHPNIGITVLVVPKEDVIDVSQVFLKKRSDVRIIAGGDTRRQSTFNALLFLSELKVIPKFVLIHDAARPFISQMTISSVIIAARRFGGAVVGKQAVDLTLKVINGNIKEALQKNLTYSGYTPQCFKFGPLFQVYQRYLKSKSARDDYSFDSIELLLKYKPSFKIKMVGTPFPSHKITFVHDLEVAKVLLKYLNKL